MDSTASTALREQLAATREILRAISRMPAQTEALCELILRNALRLADCQLGAVGLYEGGRRFRFVAVSGVDEAFAQRWLHHRYDVPAEVFKEDGPWRPLQMSGVDVGRVLAPADPVFAAFSAHMPEGQALFIPMASGEQLLGTFTIVRSEHRPFSEEEVGFVHAFADHAMVALENARVLADLERQNALQAANAEILRAISRTPDQLESICEMILNRAMALADTRLGHILLYEGNRMFRTIAVAGTPVGEEVYWRGRSHLGVETVFKEAGPWRPLHVPDIQTAAPLFQHDPVLESVLVRSGVRAFLYIPLVSGHRMIGAFGVAKTTPGAFSDSQIGILQSFSDHAVVAIENASVLKALDRQSALHAANGEILSAISHGRSDPEPIFNVILRTTARFTDTPVVGLGLHEGDGNMRFVAGLPSEYIPNWKESRYRFSLKLLRPEGQWRTHFQMDANDLPAPRFGDAATKMLAHFGVRSVLTVPLVVRDELIGVFHACRTQVEPFSEAVIATVRAFADYAVIALENFRVFQSLQSRNLQLTEALDQQTATSEILRVISQSQQDTQPVFDAIVLAARRLCNAFGVLLTLVDGDRLQAVAVDADRDRTETEDIVRRLYPRPIDASTANGRTVLSKAVVYIPDVRSDPGYGATEEARDLEFRCIVGVPMLHGDVPLGAITVVGRQPDMFTERQIAMLRVFADQAAIAIRNTRLFRELQEKNAELEQASRHKSEFLANMSHELRTPLNAIIGFSEVLKDQFFGKLNDKQAEYARDIHDAGHHLLTLINDVLDLAKVEAGRMELLVEPFDLPSAIDSTLIMVRERASRQGVELQSQVDDRLGRFVGDERKFKQVLLNLLSNAVKFSPDGGLVQVHAEAMEGGVRMSVADRGIGIPPSQQRAIFEAFHQAESTLSVKREGTGLGLTLARRFVELHGGTLGVQSQPGEGSTFTFTMGEQPWPES